MTISRLAVDPIFSAIERHRNAHVAVTNWRAPDDSVPGGYAKLKAAEIDLDALCGIEHKAAWALLKTKPTTPEGAIALLRHVRDHLATYGEFEKYDAFPDHKNRKPFDFVGALLRNVLTALESAPAPAAA